MSISSIEMLASAWARIAEEAGFPTDYEGTATPEAHRANETIQERLREQIVATNEHVPVRPTAPAGLGVTAHGAGAVAGRIRADDPRGRGSFPRGR